MTALMNKNCIQSVSSLSYIIVSMPFKVNANISYPVYMLFDCSLRVLLCIYPLMLKVCKPYKALHKNDFINV